MVNIAQMVKMVDIAQIVQMVNMTLISYCPDRDIYLYVSFLRLLLMTLD